MMKIVGEMRKRMDTRDCGNEIYVERQLREPGFTMKQEHVHAYHEIFYLKTGSCSYYLNGNQYQLSEGDMFVVNPGDTHGTAYEGKDLSERIVIHWNTCRIPENFSGGVLSSCFIKGSSLVRLFWKKGREKGR